MELPDRILIYGVTGSGKTTLALRLAVITGNPAFEADTLTWEPGWKEVPIEAQRERIAKICAGDRWILDTAYGAWLDIPLARTELIVALDFPRWVSLGRLLRRSIARVIDQRPICNGNRERVRTLLSRDSIVMWHFRSFSQKRARIRTWQETPENPKILVFRRPRDLSRWLECLQTEKDR